VQRVYAPVDDSILAKIDEDAKGKGISRAQWVSTAIGAYLHRGEVLDGAKLEELQRDLHQLRTDKEESWRQITHLKRTEEKARTEANQAQGKADKLQAQADQAQKDLSAAREELAAIRVEADKLKEAMKVKDDEVAFLRSHVAQLTQSISQLSLKPGEEEIKKKGWWRFWAKR
jgi:chromosome segregation ATPase